MVHLNLILRIVFSLFYVLLAVVAVAPWLSRGRTDERLSFLYAATDWLLNPIRAGLPPAKIGMDVAPYVAIILLYLVQRAFSLIR
jgi:uncharacterized protein YggT (Ycf19 family)